LRDPVIARLKALLGEFVAVFDRSKTTIWCGFYYFIDSSRAAMTPEIFLDNYLTRVIHAYGDAVRVHLRAIVQGEENQERFQQDVVYRNQKLLQARREASEARPIPMLTLATNSRMTLELKDD
jgi:hypothetical protein